MKDEIECQKCFWRGRYDDLIAPNQKLVGEGIAKARPNTN